MCVTKVNGEQKVYPFSLGVIRTKNVNDVCRNLPYVDVCLLVPMNKEEEYKEKCV